MSRSRLSGLLAIPLLSASLLLTATPALALGTLDQSQTFVNSSTTVGPATGMIGQTFTAGMTGLLDTLRLMPSKNVDGAPVTIRATSAGLPTDAVSATSAITSATADD